MKDLKKYLLFLFMIENIMAQTSFLGSITSVLFYIFLTIGVLYILNGEIFKRSIFGQNKCLYLLAGVYIFYQFTFGYETISPQTILYLIAKVVTFIIIAVSVSTNWNFYAEKSPLIFSMAVLVILIYGIATGASATVNNRMLLGFTNANTTSSMSVFAFAGILFMYSPRKLTIMKVILLLFCVYGLLAGGSRKGIMTLFIVLFFYRGVSFKAFPVILLLSMFVFIALPEFDIKLAGIERFVQTLSGEEGTNRELEREAARIMIDKRPWTGWGFEAQNVGEAAIVSELGSHNGYLEMTKYMGYPCTILWFSVLGIFVLSFWRFIQSKDDRIRYHLTIVIALLGAAMYEALFVGVHELTTNMFFISLAVLTTYQYRVSGKRVK